MRKLFALVLVVFSLTQAQYLDVPPTHWAAEAVQELTELGVLTGYPDQTFRGNRNITRYETAVALWRLLKVLTQNPRYATTDAVEALAEAVQQLSLSPSTPELDERIQPAKARFYEGHRPLVPAREDYRVAPRVELLRCLKTNPPIGPGNQRHTLFHGSSLEQTQRRAGFPCGFQTPFLWDSSAAKLDKSAGSLPGAFGF